MNDPRDVFSERLRERMEARSFTSTDVASGVLWMQGVTVEEVDAWLDGSSFPCPRRFRALQAALGVSRDELLT